MRLYLLASLLTGSLLSAAEFPAPAVDQPASANHAATAVFAGGCFWGVEAVFERLNGVTNAVSGFAGGTAATAHYEVVSIGDHRARRIGAGDLRSGADFLRQAARSFLFGGARSNGAESPGAGRRHAVPVGYFLLGSGSEARG